MNRITFPRSGQNRECIYLLECPRLSMPLSGDYFMSVGNNLATESPPAADYCTSLAKTPSSILIYILSSVNFINCIIVDIEKSPNNAIYFFLVKIDKVFCVYKHRNFSDIPSLKQLKLSVG